MSRWQARIEIWSGIEGRERIGEEEERAVPVGIRLCFLCGACITLLSLFMDGVSQGGRRLNEDLQGTGNCIWKYGASRALDLEMREKRPGP